MKMEDEYFGEGEANENDGAINASAVCNALKNSLCDEDIIDTLFKNCGGTASGKVRISMVLRYLKTTSQLDEDFEELQFMFGYGFEDAWIDLDDFREVMLKYIKAKRDRNDSTPPEEIVSDNKLQWSPERKRASAITAVSSPGILDLSNMANCTFGSIEGIGGDHSNSFDVLQLLFDNDELQLQLRNLREKQCKQDVFVAQLEEQASQQQLQSEIREKNMLSLQEKFDALQLESREWKNQLERSEEENRLQKERIEMLDAKVKHQEVELSQSNLELESMKKTQQELRRFFSSQKSLREEAEMKNSILEGMIEEQATSAGKVEDIVHNLRLEISSLQSEKNDLRNSLLEANDELFSLQGRMSISCKRPIEDDGYDFNGHSAKKLHSGIHFNITKPFPSTPLTRMSSLSINEEIRQAIAVNEIHLPSPFCEKPELSNWENFVDESGSAEDASAIFSKDEQFDVQIGKGTLESVIEEDDMRREEFLLLWTIFIELSNAANKANQVADTFRCIMNSSTSDQLTLSRVSDDAAMSAEECELLERMESRDIPVGTCVDIVQESIWKRVNTITDCLTQMQSFCAQLLRSKPGPSITDELHETRGILDAEDKAVRGSPSGSCCRVSRDTSRVFLVFVFRLVVFAFFVNRLMLVPFSVASSEWDEIGSQLFRPFITFSRDTPLPM